MIITGCGNNYQTIKKLGSGSFGTVYQVRDIATNIDYAIKIISKQLIAQYDANAMIQNEIAIHYTCNHKNIVRLYTYWEDSNSIYLLLEYCSKGHLIIPKTQFNDDDVFQVFHQILNGVDYLHQNNIMHRDLKFENILIHEDGTLKLCDFGWAVKVQQLPIQNVMCGTTEYMPPEVVSKYVLDFKLDCWSLGVILYALVHYKFPFDASNQQELIKNILFNQLTIPKRIGIDDGLINLIQALLIKNAQLRPTIQQIYLCKWMKQHMKKNNLFNHYENEALKQKVKSKNIQLKIVQNQDKQFFTPKKMVNSCMTKDDFEHHHISIRAPLTCAKLNNSSRTISISTNPSPQPNQQSQIERFFNFLEQKTKLL